MKKTKRKIRIITLMLALFLMACGMKEQTEGGEISAERVKKGAESARNTLEKAETAETEKDSAETAENMPEKAADTAETEARGTSAKGETETADEQEQEISDNVILAHATENIEYTDEVIKTQYTDDLSLLENLKYTNHYYAYQDGKVYYRRYHEDSFEATALWGNYDTLSDKEKEIVRIDADGSESVLFTDKGIGSIYLLNDRFYMTDKTAENGYGLYSVDMQGNDRINYGDATIRIVDTERKLLVMEKTKKEHSHVYTEYSYSYCIINYETGEEKPLLPDRHSADGSIIIKDYQDGWIYYVNRNYNQNNDFISEMCAVSVEGEQREIIAVTSAHNQESKKRGYGYRESILDVKVDGDRLYFIFGGYDGSLQVFQGGLLVSVKLDGTDYKAVETDGDFFYISYDKGKSLVHFQRWDDFVNQSGMESGSYDTMVWDVETDKCCYSDFPNNFLAPYFYAACVIRYYPTDGGVLYSVGTSETIMDGEEKRWRNKTGVYATISDDSGRIITLVADIEQYIVKWKEEEADINYGNFYYADGFLYFKAEYNAYDKESSIGWRDGYRRLHTDVCRLKIGESKAEILYSY